MKYFNKEERNEYFIWQKELAPSCLPYNPILIKKRKTRRIY